MRKKLLFLGLIFILFLSLSIVSADDNQNLNQTLEEQPAQEEIISIDDDSQLETDDNEDINIEVNNVFKGEENTIKISIPKATGNVNVTVGNKTYNPEIVDGVAIQRINDYQDGLNNVLINYNNMSKSTSFKVLNGIVNNETFFDYFDQTKGGELYDYIPQGATLDFQGRISSIDLNTRFNITINKPINIISTMKNAFIDCNTTAGTLLGDNPGDRFAINKGGSKSNVSGIYFHNTQVWLYNTHYVTLNNISVVVEDQRVGSGVGATSVRANSTYCTVKNSYFYTRNNGGSSSLVMAWADYCTFDNNTVVVEGNVGNMIYATTYNVNIPHGVSANAHNRIINNRLLNAGKSSAICYGICVSGNNTLVENNTCTYKGAGIIDQWGDVSWGYDIVPGRNRYINNTLNGCSLSSSINSISYNNKVYSDMTIIDGSIAHNNYVSGTLFIKGNHIDANNNTVKKISIEGNNLNISNTHTLDDGMIISINGDNVTISNIAGGTTAISGNNNKVDNSLIKNNVIISGSNNIFRNNTVIGTITVQSAGNYIEGNNVSSTKSYAVELRKSGNYVMNNYLLSSNNFADNAVNSFGTNTIKDNYPLPPVININVESIDKYDKIITVTVPNCTGTIVMQVSDKTYSLTLSNSSVTQRISGLDPGNYTLTVNYQDDKSPIYSTNTTAIQVPKIDAYTFELVKNEFMEGNVVIPINLPADSDGKVIIDGIYEGHDNVVLNYTKGEYDIEINYTDSQRYADKSINAHISIIHNPKATLVISDISTYYTTGKITIKLIDYKLDALANIKINVNINSKNYEVETDEKGIAILEYSLGIGTYKLTAKFNGNSNYNETSQSATVKILSRFSKNKNIQMNYYDGTKYTVKVFGDDGKAAVNQLITISINGKSNKVKTDKNGYASLKITNLPKTYIITATYKGQSIKNTVKVNQNLKTSKVTVKKSAKKFTLKATLKNKLKGKKITFKFNKKTYTATTDKKGIAKVTLKKKVIKKLKKGKKYTYTAKYVSNTVKNKVTVK